LLFAAQFFFVPPIEIGGMWSRRSACQSSLCGEYKTKDGWLPLMLVPFFVHVRVEPTFVRFPSFLSVDLTKSLSYLKRVGLTLERCGSYQQYLYCRAGSGSLYRVQADVECSVTYASLPESQWRPVSLSPFLPTDLLNVKVPLVVPTGVSSVPVVDLDIPRSTLGVKDKGMGGFNPYGHGQTTWEERSYRRLYGYDDDISQEAESLFNGWGQSRWDQTVSDHVLVALSRARRRFVRMNPSAGDLGIDELLGDPLVLERGVGKDCCQ